MPFTINHLRQAIQSQNLHRFRTIVQERDEKGHPTVNINCRDNKGTSLFSEILASNHLTSQNKLDMLLTLLAEQDNNNNPILQLNELNGVYTALDLACNPHPHLNINHRRTLIDRIVNLRYANGNRACDIKKHSFGILIDCIANMKDPVIFNTLADLREADGSYTLDVNEVCNKFCYRGAPVTVTPLDVAYGKLYYTRSEVSAERRAHPEIIEILLDRHALQFHELQAAQNGLGPAEIKIQNEFKLPEIKEQKEIKNSSEIKLDEKNQEINNFNQQQQNTHNEKVEATVATSLKALDKRYNFKENSFLISQYFSQIEHYLNSNAYSNHPSNVQKKDVAWQVFNRICTRMAESIHARSGLKAHYILALVWEGINDEKALPDDNKLENSTDINNYIELRKQSLFDKLYEIGTTYGDESGLFSSACFGGTINQITKALDKAHPDVFIITAGLDLQEFAFECAKTQMKNALIALPPKEQIKILATWKDIGEKIDPPPSAVTFHEEMRNKIHTRLTTDYGTVLSAQFIEDIIGDIAYSYFPCPEIHKDLQRLIGELQKKSPLLEKGIIESIFDESPPITIQESYEKLLIISGNVELESLKKQIEEKQNFLHDEALALLGEVTDLTTLVEKTAQEEKTAYLLSSLQPVIIKKEVIKTLCHTYEKRDKEEYTIIFETLKKADKLRRKMQLYYKDQSDDIKTRFAAVRKLAYHHSKKHYSFYEQTIKTVENYILLNYLKIMIASKNIPCAQDNHYKNFANLYEKLKNVFLSNADSRIQEVNSLLEERLSNPQTGWSFFSRPDDFLPLYKEIQKCISHPNLVENYVRTYTDIRSSSAKPGTK